MIEWFILLGILGVAAILWSICRASGQCDAVMQAKEQELYIKQWKENKQCTLKRKI